MRVGFKLGQSGCADLSLVVLKPEKITVLTIFLFMGDGANIFCYSPLIF